MAPGLNLRRLNIDLSSPLAACFAFIGVWPSGYFWTPESQGLIVGICVALVALAWVRPTGILSIGMRTDKVTRTDLAIIAGLLILVGLLAAHRLAANLWSDGIYHASMAVRPAQLLLFDVRAKTPEMWEDVSGMNAGLLVQGFCLAAMAVIVTLFVILPKMLGKRRIILAIIWVTAFLFARRLFSNDLGMLAGTEGHAVLMPWPGYDPHPQLRLLPLVASTAVFGTNVIAYRIVGFLALMAVCAGLYLTQRHRFGRTAAALLAASLATLPGLLQTAVVTESSIWLALGGVVLFFALAHPMAEGDERPIAALGVICLLAAMMRAPGFLTLIPFFAILAHEASRRRLRRSELIAAAALTALTLAISAGFVLNGTPAISDRPPLDQFIWALINGAPGVALVTVIGLVPLMFIGYALHTRDTREGVLSATVVGYLLIAMAVFYGPTHTMLWGTPRYQAEIAAPVIAAGLLAFLIQAFDRAPQYSGFGRSTSPGSKSLWHSLPLVPLVVLIGANVFNFMTLDLARISYFQHPIPGQTHRVDAIYDLDAAFERSKATGGLGGLYFVGMYYGGFPAALNGATVGDFVAFSELNQKYRESWRVNFDAVVADPAVQAVVMEAESNWGGVDYFTALGWPMETLGNPDRGLQMHYFRRPQPVESAP